MLDEILHFFMDYGPLEFDKAGEPSDEALKVATAALLWETCLADNELEELEVSRVTAVLRSAFQISDKEVEVISSICCSESSAGRMNEFINRINERFDKSQREKIVKYAGELADVSHGLNISEAVVCDLLRKRLNIDEQ